MTGVAVDSPNERAYLIGLERLRGGGPRLEEHQPGDPGPPVGEFRLRLGEPAAAGAVLQLSGRVGPQDLRAARLLRQLQGPGRRSDERRVRTSSTCSTTTPSTPYQDPQAGYPTEPLGGEPDSAAADPVSGKMVVPSEGDSVAYVVDLSIAVFDKAHKSVTAPHLKIGRLERPGADRRRNRADVTPGVLRIRERQRHGRRGPERGIGHRALVHARGPADAAGRQLLDQPVRPARHRGDHQSGSAATRSGSWSAATTTGSRGSTS